MRWYDRVLDVLSLPFLLGLPVGALYAAYRLRVDKSLAGWRIWIGRVGALYSVALLAMAVLWLVWPHPGEWGARVDANRFAPYGFWSGAAGLVFALLGKGRVRLGILLASIGACSFWFMLVALQ